MAAAPLLTGVQQCWLSNRRGILATHADVHFGGRTRPSKLAHRLVTLCSAGLLLSGRPPAKAATGRPAASAQSGARSTATPTPVGRSRRPAGLHTRWSFMLLDECTHKRSAIAYVGGIVRNEMAAAGLDSTWCCRR